MVMDDDLTLGGGHTCNVQLMYYGDVLQKPI